MRKKLREYLFTPSAWAHDGITMRRAAILLFAVVMASAKVSAQLCPLCEAADGVEQLRDEPTCEGWGRVAYMCPAEGCGYCWEEELEPLGHNWIWNRPNVITPATCTECGYEQYPCSRCDAYSEDFEIPALGHDFCIWQVITEPLCTSKGTGHNKCSRCDEYDAVQDIPALGHVMNSIGVCTRCSDMESVTLLDDDSAQPDGCKNADRITAASNVNHTLPVTLSGRTLSKSGEWNTLCLPFSMSAAQIAASSLNGATIKELSSSSNLASNGTMTLTFTTVYDATEAPNGGIVAGKPYIVKWKSASGSVSNPTFPNVAVSSSSPTASTFTNNANTGGSCQFVGQYAPFEIVSNDVVSLGANQGYLNEIILLSTGSRLGYSTSERTKANGKALKCFRAHFYVPANSDGTGARAFVMDFGDGEQTGILNAFTDAKDAENGRIYTLDGRLVESLPSAKGVYIINGKKVIVK